MFQVMLLGCSSCSVCLPVSEAEAYFGQQGYGSQGYGRSNYGHGGGGRKQSYGYSSSSYGGQYQPKVSSQYGFISNGEGRDGNGGEVEAAARGKAAPAVVFPNTMTPPGPQLGIKNGMSLRHRKQHNPLTWTGPA